MRRVGSLSLGDYPEPVVRIECESCGRAGRYRLDCLIQRFGSDVALPDLLVEIAKCERRTGLPRSAGCASCL